MLRMDKNDHAAIQAVLSGNKEAYKALWSYATARASFRVPPSASPAMKPMRTTWCRKRSCADI